MENRIAKRQYIISTALRVKGQRNNNNPLDPIPLKSEKKKKVFKSRDQIVHILL